MVKEQPGAELVPLLRCLLVPEFPPHSKACLHLRRVLATAIGEKAEVPVSTPQKQTASWDPGSKLDGGRGSCPSLLTTVMVIKTLSLPCDSTREVPSHSVLLTWSPESETLSCRGKTGSLFS